MLFAQFTKADGAKREIVGWAAVEMPDEAGEIMDYNASKKHFIEWSRRVRSASRGKSLGSIRDSHTSRAVGKVSKVIFDDAKRGIKIVAKILDSEAWTKVVEGVFTGFSIGGKYGRVWPDPNNPALRRYEAIPTEISLVDTPCIPGAVFEFIKSDGSSVKVPLYKEKRMERTMNEEILQILAEAGLSEDQAQALAERLAALFEAKSKIETETELSIDNGDAAPGMTVDDIKSIVMTILEELGLVSKVGDALALGTKIGGLEKALAARDAKIAELQKALTSDLAKLAVKVEQLEQRGASGPVLREISGGNAAKAQQADALRKALAGVKDPALIQLLQNEIAKLEIASVIA